MALLTLWLLFELPTTLRPHGIKFGALRPTGEFLGLLTAYAVISGRRNERLLKRIWLPCVIAIIVWRVDWIAGFLLTRSTPLLYDQLFLLRHLFVLIGDLWGVMMVLCLVGIALVVWGTIALSLFLARASKSLFVPSPSRGLAVALGVAWCAVLTGTLVDRTDRTVLANVPIVRWMLPDLYANARNSVRIYLTVRRGIFDSPYKGYADIELSRRPNVTFVFVESYGRIISDSADLGPRWRRGLDGMQRRLSAEGWHMASAFATAPVSGGRSWLADGSIFMGTNVQHESVFRQLLRSVPHLPTLVSFLADHGYDTIALEPSVRVRPGVEEVNYYRIAHQIDFDDLHYTGPKVGWGLVPDQYSLGFAEQRVLASSNRPRFFAFHMVTSHMPWDTVPAIVDDWRTLNDAPGNPIRNAHEEHWTFFDRMENLAWRLRRYGREDMLRWVAYRNLASSYRERYLDTVQYDLSVIERHLLQEHSDEIVVVMGDHQPPAVTPEGANYDVPVHVFARDPALLAEFLERGFSPGLTIAPSAPPAIEHAGFFSLLVRTLLRVQPTRSALPPYLPRGMPLRG
jgi:hypothetical protein